MKLVTLLIILSAALWAGSQVPFETRPMNYCYERLNPVETAKATRMATYMFFSCKDEMLKLNVRPGIIQEANRFCLGYRFCYSVAEERTNNTKALISTMFDCVEKLAAAGITVKPDWETKYNFNWTIVLKKYRICASQHMPRDIRYVLWGFTWLKDLGSG
ncbi:uncharacterized protein LOC144167410 [Haemaphysalis longicornis]